MRPLYSLRSVKVKYDSKVALDVALLNLYENRVHILAGPNGSGKSTLLGLLAFLSKPSDGEMLYKGERVDWKANVPQMLRKEVTLLHQAPYLFDGTVFDNVAIGLKIRRAKNNAYHSIVSEFLEQVGLKGFESRKAKALSGGEKQRVALARALALTPQVLLLDEPFSNVDSKATEIMENLLPSLPAKGITVVIASHDRQLEAKVNGETINLHQGELMSSQDSGCCLMSLPDRMGTGQSGGCLEIVAG